MSGNVVKIEQAGAANQPSPSIWKNCRNRLLNDLGLGQYSSYEGCGANTGVAGAGELRAVVGDFEMTSDDETVLSNILPVDEHGGRIDIETDADDNDAWHVHTGVGIGMVLNSGNKIWMEARVALGAAADQGFFLGLIEEDGIPDAITDDCATVIAQSLFGFQVVAGDTTAVDAVVQLDAAGVTKVLADATNSTAFTNAGGTAKDFPVADAYTKFGLYFDGGTTLSYFLDGFKVASLTLVSGTHPVSVEMAPMIALKTGTAAAQSGNISFARYAFQERS